MAKKIGQRTYMLDNRVCIRAAAGVAGSKEANGPLGGDFDKTFQDDTLGQSSWEKAESQLQYEAAQLALSKAGISNDQVDAVLAGDLLNQCISSTFGLRQLEIPFLGQYGACSTMAQTMVMASLLCDGGGMQNTLAVTSSHFCSAERQFRLPIDYGGQRTPTAQWTVTGAGAALIAQGGKDCQIKGVTIGKILDYQIKDAANMGAAMAPAAADTILSFLHDTGCRATDFDLILTGDLGFIGSELLLELMKKNGVDISGIHQDCGKMIYDRQVQDVHAGGSGCGCCGSVFCSHIYHRLKNRELKNILFAATGALMSPTSSQQGETIPGISHLLHITAE